MTSTDAAPGAARRPSSIGLRLALAALTLVLLCLAMAYWWLGNLTHELAGSAIFLLLGRHLWSNLRWWRTAGRGRYGPYRSLTTALTLALAVSFVLLVFSSVAISQSLFAFLPLPNGFTWREIHWFSAGWFLALAALHLGLHAPLIWCALARRLSVSCRRCVGTIVVPALLMLAWHGLASLEPTGMSARLTFSYSLAMWDFTESVWPFFLHWLATVALIALPTAVIAFARSHRSAT